ncbi:Transcription factor [Nymphaea thermarum]|nr:Transcription factor [Nymphaea thermarum]
MGSNPIFDIFDVGGIDSGMYLNYDGFNDPSNAGLEIDDSFAGASGSERMGSKKRARDESCSRPGSKACREKMRRDKLNDRQAALSLPPPPTLYAGMCASRKPGIPQPLHILFVELGSILDPGRPVKVDKASILIDAARTLNHLRSEAEKLKEANEKLQETIKDLKSEKNELREEKTKLKAEKEKLEQQLNAMSMSPPGYMPHPAALHAAAAAAFAAQASAAGNKGMPFAGYPGIAMWQYMPPAHTDTSQDSKLRPPAA